MSWFKRHLNWSMLIGYILSIALLPIFFGVNPLKDWSVYDSIPTLIGWIIVTVWGLKVKQRSRWYLLTIFIPIVGWLIPALISSRQSLLEKAWAKNKSIRNIEHVQNS